MMAQLPQLLFSFGVGGKGNYSFGLEGREGANIVYVSSYKLI